MHFRRAVFLINIFFIFFISAKAVSAVLPGQDEERLLRSELKLAQKTHIYFILDLKENRVYIKARGIVLKDLKIKGMRLWGPAETVKLYAMIGKASYSDPRREEIIPENIKKDEISPAPAANAPAFDLKALELDDMPASFILKFDGNFTVYVRPDNKGFLPGIYSAINSFNWHISQPIITVWHSVKKSPYGALNLFLDENDARALYWSINEGADVLIYNPQNH